MTMGPWGVHYERTQTWWDWTQPWHDYLARCQYLLRQGRFVADICYLQAEAPPQGFHNHKRDGHDWDECSADVVLNRMTVRDGRLVLPDGMNYRLLVLPESATMTPALLGKIKELVEAGATVVGPRPLRSPSLSGYPKCDEEVKSLADALWGDCNGTTIKEHKVGRGRVVWGIARRRSLPAPACGPTSRAAPIFASSTARPTMRRSTSWPILCPARSRPLCSFRVTGRQPELWWPDTGRMEAATLFVEQGGVTKVLLPLDPSGSVFVVFRKGTKPVTSIAAVTQEREAAALDVIRELLRRSSCIKAAYGVLGDPARTRDVRAKVQQIVDAGEDRFEVARMAAGDDPAFGVVKTLIVDYTIGNQRGTSRGTDPETIVLSVVPPLRANCRPASATPRDTWCSTPGNRDVMRSRRRRGPSPRDRGLRRCRTPWRSTGPGRSLSHRTREHPGASRSTRWPPGPRTATRV